MMALMLVVMCLQRLLRCWRSLRVQFILVGDRAKGVVMRSALLADKVRCSDVCPLRCVRAAFCLFSFDALLL